MMTTTRVEAVFEPLDTSKTIFELLAESPVCADWSTAFMT